MRLCYLPMLPLRHVDTDLHRPYAMSDTDLRRPYAMSETYRASSATDVWYCALSGCDVRYARVGVGGSERVQAGA
eukprot:1257629-Rhodomonas_salina.2